MKKPTARLSHARSMLASSRLNTQRERISIMAKEKAVLYHILCRRTSGAFFQSADRPCPIVVARGTLLGGPIHETNDEEERKRKSYSIGINAEISHLVCSPSIDVL